MRNFLLLINMKTKLIFISLFVCLTASAQTVDVSSRSKQYRANVPVDKSYHQAHAVAVDMRAD